MRECCLQFSKALSTGDYSRQCDLDLDLDSTRIQVDALGHTPTPF